MKRLIKSAHVKLCIQLILVMRRTEWTIQGNVHKTQIEDKKNICRKVKRWQKRGCTQIFANVFQFLSDHKIPIVLPIAKYGKNLACDVGMKK